MNSKFKFALAVSVAATLAACGGGGGGSTTAATPTPPVVTPPVVVPPTVTPADLQTSVPALTYPANSPEFAFVTAYNNFRSQVGLGLLAQNASLDKAAANHVKYVTTNALTNGGTVDMSAINATYNMPNFHVEDAAKVGFTGILPNDRAAFAGYKASYVGENGTYGNGSGGALAFASLLATVYHRQGLMYQAPRDIGIVVGTDQFQTTSEMVGYQVTGQSNAGDYVGTYPVDTQTLVPLFAGFETPNPFADIKDNTRDNVAANTSYPITVSAKEFTTLAVTTFTVTEAGQTAPLKVRLITNATDSAITAWNAMIVGFVPFKPNTKYNVSFVGTVNGANVVKAWSFTTASSCINLASCK
ncbi:CAP domain-containing protein [Rugamonas sp. A1-17]|nr:CAP domain-containing protein [Rugamonas sp. A1-17]